MKKIYLLRDKKDFDKLFKLKKQINSPLYTIFYLNNLLEYSRFGILISKKKIKKAVDRNYSRRQIKSILRSVNKTLNKNIDFLIIVNSNFKNVNFDSKKKELLKLIDKILLM